MEDEMGNFKKPASVVLALVLAILGGVISAPFAHAEQAYPIAFTEIGIYPRVAPSMDSERNGNALSDGTMVTIDCELEGQPVFNGMATISIWAKTPYGYIPTSFINTGTNEWTPGVPRCGHLAEPTNHTPEGGPVEFSGTRIADNDIMSSILHTHFFVGGGQPAIIDWSFFTRHHRFMEWIKALPVRGKSVVYSSYSTDPSETQMMLSLGSFTVKRHSENCFYVHDYYDFDWMYVLHNTTSAAGLGKEFHIFSSGCI